MVSGDLTLTNYGQFNLSGAALKTAVDAINLPAATDNVFIIPVSNGTAVQVLKVVRAA